MTRTRLSLAALLLVAVAACSDSTAPQNPYGSFVAAPDASGPYPAPTPTAQVTQGQVEVDGWIDTPTPCYTVSGNATVSHDTLVAHIVARKDAKNNVGCEQAIQPWKYILTAVAVPSTVGVLRVVHDDSGNGTNVTVLEQAITP